MEPKPPLCKDYREAKLLLDILAIILVRNPLALFQSKDYIIILILPGLTLFNFFFFPPLSITASSFSERAQSQHRQHLMQCSFDLVDSGNRCILLVSEQIVGVSFFFWFHQSQIYVSISTEEKSNY